MAKNYLGQSSFDLGGVTRTFGTPDDPFYDQGERKPLATREHFGKGSKGYQITFQPGDGGSYVTHSLDFKGMAPSAADFPDGFLPNMFDNANWKSLNIETQAALYNKAFVGDYLWDDNRLTWKKPNTTAGGSNPISDKAWGRTQDSTHGLDIARVIPGSPWEQGNYSDNDLWRLDQAKKWDPDSGEFPDTNMDRLFKHMTEGQIDWAHYNDDGLYQAAAWQLDQDGNKHWVDQGARSGYNTVDKIRASDSLLGNMNAEQEQDLLKRFHLASAQKASNQNQTEQTRQSITQETYRGLNPDDTYLGPEWQHVNTAGQTVTRHYTPTYQQVDYQVPEPGQELSFNRVDEGQPNKWDSDSNTLTWAGKNIKDIRATKLTPRSDVVPPTVNIPSNMTQQIYRPDNLPSNVYGTITSDAVWTDKDGTDRFAAGGKSQSLTIKNGRLVKGDTFTPRSQNLSDMTIKAGGK